MLVRWKKDFNGPAVQMEGRSPTENDTQVDILNSSTFRVFIETPFQDTDTKLNIH